MNFLVYWILLGSLGLNLLWMYQDEKHSVKDLLRGFLFGLIIGPLSITLFVYFFITDKK